MRILGLDPGTVRMGFGVIQEEGEELKLLSCGVLTAARSDPLPDRLYALYSQILELVSYWQPNALAVEEPFVAKNVRSAMAVGQAEAVALIAAAHFGVPAFTYSPRQVKQSVADYGGGSKEQVQEMVRVHLGLSYLPEPIDATDALAVAICHSHHLQEQRLIMVNDQIESSL
ncbi:MAG: crossover junction endodeoxyribonuclease RuvC [Chloroflexi bacterium]|nr:crossover junction endodeoxyribonuclease RuvC [Chloroflexota bacterium]